MTLSGQALRKVTAFVTRKSGGGEDVLLIETSHAGVQFPAGTVEDGEDPESAALREACEETGLAAFGSVRAAGVLDLDIAPPGAATLHTTPVHLYPRADSASMASIRNGLAVTIDREEGGFAQVTFREYEDVARTVVSAQITGWAPLAALTRKVRRFFFVLPFVGEAPAGWMHSADHHHWRLFWAPVDRMPAIVAGQAPWADVLRAALRDAS